MTLEDKVGFVAGAASGIGFGVGRFHAVDRVKVATSASSWAIRE